VELLPVHPYIPNSDPETKREMLKEIGVQSVEELFADIPERIRLKKRLELPYAKSEYHVRREVEAILSRNRTCNELISFLGAGCWPHYVPAVCDEINSRSEFLTAYAGDVYSDLGRYQAFFEFQSMIGDLVAMDVVSFPWYGWGNVENPTYLGFVESQCEEISEIAHDHGALFTVGVEPLSLGVLAPPGEYGADIVCGEGQPLGMHMNFGGGLLGFLACRDDERFVSAMPHRLITITTTEQKGEWGFTYVLPERTMFAARDKAKSFTGTATALWAITAAVYLSLLGPNGLRELAEVIMQKSHYAIKRMSEIGGIKVPVFNSCHFEEFTANFDATRKTVSQVNRALLNSGVIGGKDITGEFPELGNTALYCVTEMHTKADIDKLAAALEEAIR
jgi:glycine dehydrogenase subunit 1